MDRGITCSYERIRKIWDDCGWEKIAFHSFSRINIISPIAKQLPSLEEFLAANSGTSIAIDPVELFISTLRKEVASNTTVQTCTKPSFDINKNCSDIYLYDSEIHNFKGNGVAELVDLRQLKRHWKDSPTAGRKDYSWAVFFNKGNLPVSNSAIIIDRYLFIAKDENNIYSDGYENVQEILKSIIPPDFKGTYYILFIFEEEQIAPRRLNITNIAKALNTINNNIQSLKREGLSIHSEFLAISKSDQKTAKDYKNVSRLYNYTHDRRMITNFYTVTASHGFILSKHSCNGKPVINQGQDLCFECMFAGIDNEDQEVQSLPYNRISECISSLNKMIKGVSDTQYKCFCSHQRGKLDKVHYNDFINPLIKNV